MDKLLRYMRTKKQNYYTIANITVGVRFSRSKVRRLINLLIKYDMVQLYEVHNKKKRYRPDRHCLTKIKPFLRLYDLTYCPKPAKEENSKDKPTEQSRYHSRYDSK